MPGTSGRGIVTKAGLVEPREDAFDGFRMQRNTTFFPALAEQFEHLVPATLLEIPHAQSGEFTDTTRGIGEDTKDRSVAMAHWRVEIGSFEQFEVSRGSLQMDVRDSQSRPK